VSTGKLPNIVGLTEADTKLLADWPGHTMKKTSGHPRRRDRVGALYELRRARAMTQQEVGKTLHVNPTGGRQAGTAHG
jgi:hypothetical protein